MNPSKHHENIALVIVLAALIAIAAVLWLAWSHFPMAPAGMPVSSQSPATTSPALSDLPNAYSFSGPGQGFSIRYPDGYSVDSSYEYQELGPGMSISGVKFTIPESVATGTNLSNDSYVSVEEIPATSTCSATMFLDAGPITNGPVMLTDGGVTYSVGSSTGAGAGNRYEETVYAIPGTDPCIAVRYFIHYGVIENYPVGMVSQFDEAALKAQFDEIRRSLTIGK